MNSKVIATFFVLACVTFTWAQNTTKPATPAVPDKARTEFTCEAKDLTKEEQVAFVKLLNEWRHKVAGGSEGLPKGANVRELRWDDNVAINAKAWAGECKSSNSAAERHAKDREGRTLELVYVATNCKPYTDGQWVKAVTAWASGKSQLTQAVISKYTADPQRTHQARATAQLAWGETAFVGCAYSNSGKVGGSKDTPNFKQYIVCQFLQAGNNINEAVYVVGDPTTKCAQGYKKSDTPGLDNLCKRDPSIANDCEYCTKKPEPPKPVQTCNANLMTQSEKDLIVAAFNAERSKVALGAYAPALPTASNMKMLTWNDSLETSAKNAAGSCSASTDNTTANLRVAELFYGAGGTTRFTSPQWPKAIQNWNAARSSVSATLIDTFSLKSNADRVAKTYTQLVWAKSSNIGCAYSNQESLWTSKFGQSIMSYRQYIVCHIKEAGNIEGQAVYAKGTTCAGCESGSTCDVKGDGLCKLPAKK